MNKDLGKNGSQEGPTRKIFKKSAGVPNFNKIGLSLNLHLVVLHRLSCLYAIFPYFF